MAEQNKYPQVCWRLKKETRGALEKIKKRKDIDWNCLMELAIFLINKEDNKQFMGLLDNILNAPQKTKSDFFVPHGKEYDDASGRMNCETCGREFQGQAWMVKSKKSITCPSCWGAEKRREEFEPEGKTNF